MKKNEPVPILFPRAASTLFDAKKGIKEYVFHLTSKIIQSIYFDNLLGMLMSLVQSVCKYFFSYFRIFLSRYQIFKSDFFLSLSFPILLSDFTIELLSKNLITKWEKLMTKKNLI